MIALLVADPSYVNANTRQNPTICDPPHCKNFKANHAILEFVCILDVVRIGHKSPGSERTLTLGVGSPMKSISAMTLRQECRILPLVATCAIRSRLDDMPRIPAKPVHRQKILPLRMPKTLCAFSTWLIVILSLQAHCALVPLLFSY